MTDIDQKIKNGLKKRHAKEKRFRFCGILSILFSVVCLSTLIVNIVSKGLPAFEQTAISLEFYVDPGIVAPETLATADYGRLIKNTMYEMFPDVNKRRDKRELTKIISAGAAFEVREYVMEHPQVIGSKITLTVPISDKFDLFYKGLITTDNRSISDNQAKWFKKLKDEGRIEKVFNWDFFTHGDSRIPEIAGIAGALMGSILTMAITLLLSFPMAVGAAIYLEEFAPKNVLTSFIEVNINNLAAVPSVVYGLLGLAIFLNFFGLPRSAPLVGGMVLSLMTLPTIIIASRAAIKAVPPSIREAALGLGASKVQMVFHHVLPLAMPGILTGAIIGTARALGETAPLLMIGMVAFIVDIPWGFLDPSTVLPVQIYLWSDLPERAFVAKASAAIMVLLTFLISMNGIAVYLRKKFEKRW